MSDRSTKIVKKKKNPADPYPVETWARVKMLYFAEKSLSEIEAITGIGVSYLASRVHLDGWAQERKKLRAQIALATESEVKQLEERKKRWIKSKIQDAEDMNTEALKFIEYAVNAKDVRAFETATRAFERIDNIFRKNTGLDAEEKYNKGKPNFTLQLITGEAFDPSENRIKRADAIDVDSESLDR